MEKNHKKKLHTFLLEREKFGIKLGLKNISLLLNYLENPHKKFLSIHVAGSNGKGSVSNMLASILQECNLKVGLYTSPHLIDEKERIKINGKNISEKDFLKILENCKNLIQKINATYFETLTAIAFKHFANEKIDIAIIETGLGGRFDATNVVVPICSVITNISLEHTYILGNSLEKIAFEKSGIIKNGVDCVVGNIFIEAMKVIHKIATMKKSQIFIAKNICEIISHKVCFDKSIINIKSKFFDIKNINFPLFGKFQFENIQTVVSVCEIVRNKFNITSQKIKKGLEKVLPNTNFFGRLSVINRAPLIIFDVAHNVDAFQKLIFTIKNFFPKRGKIIFGIMEDKNYFHIISLLENLKIITYAVSPKTKRSLSSNYIRQICLSNNIKSFDCGTVKNGIEIALKNIEKDEYLLICGSFYVIEEAMKYFKTKYSFSYGTF